LIVSCCSRLMATGPQLAEHSLLYVGDDFGNWGSSKWGFGNPE
jgi:hypothetical protein